MRYINGWVVSLILRLIAKDFLKGNKNEKNGILYYKRWIFNQINDPFLKGNKKGNRPHYYCFKESNTGIYWIIPMSSKLEKYKKIIETKELKGKPCDTLHIAKLDNNKESVF